MAQGSASNFGMHLRHGDIEDHIGRCLPQHCRQIAADQRTVEPEFLGPPPRFKLIVFRRDGLTIAKRVVAYPGESIRVVDGALEVIK